MFSSIFFFILDCNKTIYLVKNVFKKSQSKSHLFFSFIKVLIEDNLIGIIARIEAILNDFTYIIGIGSSHSEERLCYPFFNSIHNS